MITLTLRSRADIVNAIPSLLGFTPEDSLVFVGIDTQMHARVDLASPHALKEAFAPVISKMGARIILTLYTDDLVKAAFVAQATADIFPGKEVIDTFRIHDGRTYDPYGDTEGQPVEFANLIPERAPMRTRSDLERFAECIDDADEAATAAIAAYLSGDGALAWCLQERAIALGGNTHDMTMLDRCLSEAINPRTEGVHLFPNHESR